MNRKIEAIARSTDNQASSEHFPWAGLLALAMAGFITILTETLPAGLLPQISVGLGISDALAGQLITLYAVGSFLAAIPLIAVTRGWGRRPLLLICIIGFFIFNSITALSFNFIVTLVARLFAGVSAGVLWGMTAGYARRMVGESLKGRAMAVAMVGAPIALALGVPIGTFLGTLTSWRTVFWIMSLLSLALVFWVLWKLPDYPGQAHGKRLSLHKVFLIPGVRPILVVVLAWVLAHNILYTYIAPFLERAGLAQRVDVVLLVFGMTSVIGIWVTGLWIDRSLRALVLISLSGFGLAAVLLGMGINQPVAIFVGVALWGLLCGG